MVSRMVNHGSLTRTFKCRSFHVAKLVHLGGAVADIEVCCDILREEEEVIVDS
jgi:hypothetical protein